MNDLLPCLFHEPAGEVRGAVIWLHGLGADGSDFVPLVPLLAPPGVRFVFPTAPSAPVTLNGGLVMPSWYDIRSLDHRRTDREDPDGVRASADRVRALIAREVARGVPEERIVLAGFSQGGATALYTALRHPAPLAGIVCLSGYLVLEEALEAEATAAGREAHALFVHGIHDDVVPFDGGRASFERVAALGVRAEWHALRMGHEVNAESARIVRRFLHERVA